MKFKIATGRRSDLVKDQSYPYKFEDKQWEMPMPSIENPTILHPSSPLK